MCLSYSPALFKSYYQHVHCLSHRKHEHWGNSDVLYLRHGQIRRDPHGNDWGVHGLPTQQPAALSRSNIVSMQSQLLLRTDHGHHNNRLFGLPYR